MIPAELAKLRKLERLDLSNTGITDIPAFVWTMQSLKILNISGTKVSSLGLLAENNIASLDISGLGLTELPASVNAFKNLQVLNASGNKLTTLPDEISKCEKLKVEINFFFYDFKIFKNFYLKFFMNPILGAQPRRKSFNAPSIR